MEDPWDRAERVFRTQIKNWSDYREAVERMTEAYSTARRCTVTERGQVIPARLLREEKNGSLALVVRMSDIPADIVSSMKADGILSDASFVMLFCPAKDVQWIDDARPPVPTGWALSNDANWLYTWYDNGIVTRQRAQYGLDGKVHITGVREAVEPPVAYNNREFGTLFSSDPTKGKAW